MMQKISIQDIAGVLIDKQGLSKRDAETFVTTFFQLINEGLHRDKMVKIKGLGTFKVVEVRQRESINVNTGERVVIEGHGKITFTPDVVMRDFINKPFAQFETVALNDGVDIDELNMVGTDVTDELDGDEGTVSPNTVEPVLEPEPANQDQPATQEQPGTDRDDSLQPEQTNTGVGDDYSVQQHPEQESEHSGSEQTEQTESQQEQTELELPEEPDQNQNESEQIEQTKSDEDEQKAATVTEPVHKEEQSVGNDHNDAPVAETTSIPLVTQIQPENEQNEVKPRRHRTLRVTLALVLLFIVCSAAIIFGYYLGNRNDAPIVKYVVVHAKPQPQPVVDTTAAAIAPTVSEDKDSLANAASSADDSKAEQQSGTDAKETPADSRTLRNARAIVRTGAYRIVGTSTVITVKPGETLRRISARYLGEDMACYIQVHNDITDVHEGMKIKIPRLKLKK